MASIMRNFTLAIPTIPFALPALAHFRRRQAFYINQAGRANFDLKIKCGLSSEFMILNGGPVT
jgi:hypothetical protein